MYAISKCAFLLSFYLVKCGVERCAATRGAQNLPNKTVHEFFTVARAMYSASNLVTILSVAKLVSIAGFWFLL